MVSLVNNVNLLQASLVHVLHRILSEVQSPHPSLNPRKFSAPRAGSKTSPEIFS